MRIILSLLIVLVCIPASASDNQWLCISDVTFGLTRDSADKSYSGKSYVGGQKFVVSAEGVKIAGTNEFLGLTEDSPMTCKINASKWRSLDGKSAGETVSSVRCTYADAHEAWGTLSIDLGDANNLVFEARFPYESGETQLSFGRCTSL